MENVEDNLLLQDLESFSAVATPAIFYSHWQLDIPKAVLRQKSRAVAHVTRFPQYLQTFCKKFNSMNIRQHLAILWQSLPLGTRATFWFPNPCNIRMKCCVASASKNLPRVAVTLDNL